jgi:HSP20 family molecular chaperone IbpA
LLEPYRLQKEIIMAEKTVAMSNNQEKETRLEGTRTRERYVTPPVDIYEMPDGLVVTADLPGVTPEHLNVRVDNHILTIQAQVGQEPVAEPTYREYELVNYFRQFELSDKVDEGKISADLKHGVLTLMLPKAEEAKPRKITVAVS